METSHRRGAALLRVMQPSAPWSGPSICSSMEAGGNLICESTAGHDGLSGQTGQTEHGGIAPEIWEKVKNHPCYSEQAHHHYARMHVAVAPACNIQCNYCNRKFDCSNESRPGGAGDLPLHWEQV